MLWQQSAEKPQFYALNAMTTYIGEHSLISDIKQMWSKTNGEPCAVKSCKHGSEGGLREISQENHGAYPIYRRP